MRACVRACVCMCACACMKEEESARVRGRMSVKKRHREARVYLNIFLRSFRHWTGESIGSGSRSLPRTNFIGEKNES